MKKQKQRIELADATISEQDGVRYLHLGTPWIQGAMRIRKPLKLELDYIQRMMVWLLLREPAELEDTRFLQLGLGSGALARFGHSVLRCPTTVVEINPSVIRACRYLFKLPPDDARFQVVEADAAEFVAEPARVGQFDALCVDLYDHEAASPVLDDEDFYRDCRQLLDAGGVMTVNLFGRHASFDRSFARIAAIFGEQQVAMLKPTPEGNTIVMAWRDGPLPGREILDARAEILQTRLELPARKWVQLLSPFKARRKSPAKPASPAV